MLVWQSFINWLCLSCREEQKIFSIWICRQKNTLGKHFHALREDKLLGGGIQEDKLNNTQIHNTTKHSRLLKKDDWNYPITILLILNKSDISDSIFF